ncbi:chemotaxis protein CheW [Baaleninema sp.]|uniref:chemotaxis protein CheW n=1 Tax=Baaleninema sp. TaxID=3101197 RepID=UPI003D00AEBA
METYPYLLFDLNETHYGLDAHLVQEVFFLPEVTPIAEAPPDIVGVLNLRGEIVPIMDLHFRLSRKFRQRHGVLRRDYRLSDSVIIVEWKGFRLGMVVDRVREVVSVETQDITSELSYGRDSHTTQRFVKGVAQVETELVALLDCQAVIRDARDRAASQDTSPETEESDASEPEESDLPVFCPNATPEEREVFRQRAAQLRVMTDAQDVQNLVSLAVVGLHGEYFGIDLQMVREFATINNVTPVPCCPPRIVGNMNLRGEILTLVAVDELLNLPSVERQAKKAVVVQVEDIVAGIAVDEVFDVVQVNPSEMSAIPTAVRRTGDEYLRGTAPYQGKALTVLDMHKILTKGELVVNEEP